MSRSRNASLHLDDTNIDNDILKAMLEKNDFDMNDLIKEAAEE